jgi:hypothetical protein
VRHFPAYVTTCRPSHHFHLASRQTYRLTRIWNACSVTSSFCLGLQICLQYFFVHYCNHIMVVPASLHRDLTAIAVVAAVGGRKRLNSLPARSLRKGKELVVEKPAAPGLAEPFAEFKSILGEDEGFEATYDPLRQGPLRYVWFDRGVHTYTYSYTRLVARFSGIWGTQTRLGRHLEPGYSKEASP